MGRVKEEHSDEKEGLGAEIRNIDTGRSGKEKGRDCGM